MNTPTKGPITEYGKSKMPNARAILRGSDSRCGENNMNVAKAV
jgi:hypothetical protein